MELFKIDKFLEVLLYEKLTLQEIKDTLVGCTILGTGGGGSLESGLEAVEKSLERRARVQAALLR